MRRLLLGSVLLLGATAFAGGRGGFGGARADVGLGPAWGSLNQPAWVNSNPTGYPTPLVPVTNHTGVGTFPGRSPYPQQVVVPYYFYYPVQQQQQPPPPQQVIIEREVIIEKAPEPQPAPAPQVIIVQQPAPVPVAPPAPAPVVAPEPPKPVTPYTPGPDVYSWKDEDGVVHYSTRPPADGKAKKLATLGK